MAQRHLWTVTPETHARIKDLTDQLHNLAISEAQWLDEVMRLPGYPLRGRPGHEDELNIVVSRPTRVAVSSRHTTH